MQHSKRGHAIFSASGAHTAIACSGFLFLKETVPPAPTSPQAAEGTLMHELSDKLIEAFLRHKLDGGALNEEVYDDLDMLEHAKNYRDVIWKEVLHESITEKSYMVEQKLVLDDKFQMYCYADFITIYKSDRAKRTAHAVELKYGFSPISPDKNPQLAFQLVALREELRRNGKDCDVFLASVYQPRVLNRPIFQTAKFSPKQLDSWKAKFLKIAHTVFVEKKAKFTVGEHCNYCSVRHACLARENQIKKEQLVQLALSDGIELPKVPTISVTDIAKYLEAEDRITDFFKGLRSFAINELKRGEKIPGLKLVETSRKRTWIEDEKAVAAILGCIKHIDPWQKKLKGITDVEKEVQQSLGVTKKEAGDILKAAITYKPAGISLVPENDPRPSVKNVLELLTASNEAE